jgi:4-amino-4-deoxy-L-arabinose transferase-like glycosyltransferase
MISTSTQRRRQIWLGLAFVFIVATFYRLWQLHSLPPGLFGDEAADALDALDVLAGRGQVFFPANFGREGLHMWILAGLFKWMGVTPFAIRLPSALAGIVTVLGAYWLGYELFIAPLPAHAPTWDFQKAWLITWAAALFTAISFWHVHFSRFGIRGVFTTTFAALTMAALWRAIRTRRWAWWAWAGLFMGLGSHFYTASRFIPLFVGLFLGGWALLSLVRPRGPARLAHPRDFIRGSILFFALSALIFAPLGYYFLTHPGSFTQRAGEVSAFRHGISIETLKIIGRAASLNLQQFIVPGRGDVARFYNLTGRAVFMPLTALLALLGLGISLRRWQEPVYAFLLLWFAVLVSLSFLAVDRAPTLPRVLGVIPGVFFFPAIGLGELLAWMRTRWHLKKPLLAAVTALFLLTPAIQSYHDYFQVWGPSPETQEAFQQDVITMWQWLETHPAPGPLYISSGLYKHLSFIVLYEQVPTTEFFSRQDPNLHWFDARRAWPLAQSDATILVGNSALPPADIQQLLSIQLDTLPAGSAYQATTGIHLNQAPAVWVHPQLGLIEQAVIPPGPGQTAGLMLQLWHTTGPLPDEFEAWQIQSALLDGAGQQMVQVSDEMGLRPAEWPAEGTFVTWQRIQWPPERPVAGTTLRIVPHARPPLQPAAATDGWLARPLIQWQDLLRH